MTRPDASEFIALVPAGGTGARVGGSVPKQYLTVAGQPLLVHTVRNLLKAQWLRRVYIVVAASEFDRCKALELSGDRVSILPAGGLSRRDSVLAGLEQVQSEQIAAGHPDNNPWVMVHDAARPGIPLDVLDRLKDHVLAGDGSGSDRIGALAAVPVADTVKLADQSVGESAAPGIARTIPRDALWLAQTPQVFRLTALLSALRAFPGATDEAVAMEHAGHAPALVRGHWKNLKITTRDDFELAEVILKAGDSLNQTGQDHE